jgi:YHS domain-containing protein
MHSYIFFYLIFNMAKDPVCNMNVEEKTAKYTSDIDGKKIYLCSNTCKQQFEQNPSKYGY